MKKRFCFLFLSLRCSAQLVQLGQEPNNIVDVSLPVYYFPFYNGLQIIEVDYYSQSLSRGALQDMIQPRGGSSLHDAMVIKRPNGYLLRSKTGDIIANFGVMYSEELELISPDSCKTISHLEHLNSFVNKGYQRYEQFKSELNGYGYQISRLFTREQGIEMPEMSVQLYGILDTLGSIAIPMNHYSIDYLDGEYLVERDIRVFNQDKITPNKIERKQKNNSSELNRFAIYNSSFQLTLSGSEIPIQRISKNCYAAVKKGSVDFIDRFGNPLHPNNYESIQAIGYRDLFLFTENKNDTLFQGLLSRQLDEVTPAFLTSIVSFQYGFMVRDRHQRNGYLDLYGKQIVPFELEALTIDYRKDGFIIFKKYVDVPNGKMLCSGLIDTTGKVLLPAEYWQIDNFNNEIARVQKNNKWGFINRSGELVCPIIYSSMGSLHRNFIDVTSEKGYGLVDRKGKVILEPNYTYVQWIDSMIYYGNDQDEHFFHDVRLGGKNKHSFGKLIPQDNGLSFYMKAGKYGLIDAHGKLIITAQFEKIRAYRNNRAVVQLNGKLGLIDERGKIIQAIKYEDYSYDKNGNYVLH